MSGVAREAARRGPVAVRGLRQRRPPGARAPTTACPSGELLFERELVSARSSARWAWFLGFWGIGTYKRNDEVDVRYELDGQPTVAHALEIIAPPVLTTSRAPTGGAACSADRIARVAGERLSV